MDVEDAVVIAIKVLVVEDAVAIGVATIGCRGHLDGVRDAVVVVIQVGGVWDAVAVGVWPGQVAKGVGGSVDAANVGDAVVFGVLWGVHHAVAIGVIDRVAGEFLDVPETVAITVRIKVVRDEVHIGSALFGQGRVASIAEDGRCVVDDVGDAVAVGVAAIGVERTDEAVVVGVGCHVATFNHVTDGIIITVQVAVVRHAVVIAVERGGIAEIAE